MCLIYNVETVCALDALVTVVPNNAAVFVLLK
jgi:hypothetical protein